VRLLTDPVLRSRMAHLRRHPDTPRPPERVDAVLISHLHGDHLDLPSLRLLENRPPVFAPRGAGRFLSRLGLEVLELGAGESAHAGGIRVRAVPAVHDARRRPWLGPTAQPIGFLIGESPSILAPTPSFAFTRRATSRMPSTSARGVPGSANAR